MNQIHTIRRELRDVPLILSLRVRWRVIVTCPSEPKWVEALTVMASANQEMSLSFQGRPPHYSMAHPSYPIAAQIFCAFSPVNVTSSCVEVPRSK
jgi:hypothetical protein